ncbi:hypothetical protein BJY52DRAFT_1331126 [Lactarius psammicola]|nr:hypothetical protein BJY52DRAFT_1331126 [Lactarius psammicola]
MITPPRRVLDDVVIPNFNFTEDGITSEQFLAKRLRVGASVEGDVPNYDPHSDNARLQNIVHFLADIKDMLRDMNSQWWTSENADLIRRERRALFDTRHTEEYRDTFDQQGDRASLAFVPAAQQDLIILTLEILARDPVANAATLQREAFRDACKQLAQVASTQARAQALAQTRGQMQVLPELVLETLARTQARAADSIEMVKRALEPVALSLRPQIDDMPTSYDVPPPSEILEPQVVSAAAAMVCPDDGPVPGYTGSAQKSSPPPTEATPSLLHYSTLPLAGLEAPARESGYSPV